MTSHSYFELDIESYIAEYQLVFLNSTGPDFGNYNCLIQNSVYVIFLVFEGNC